MHSHVGMRKSSSPAAVWQGCRLSIVSIDHPYLADAIAYFPQEVSAWNILRGGKGQKPSLDVVAILELSEETPHAGAWSDVAQDRERDAFITRSSPFLPNLSPHWKICPACLASICLLLG